MRLLHTSDWHLGQTLHGVRRDEEHQRFLDWLLKVLADEKIDVLVVAGDLFDSANPPPSALRMWFGFIARARERCKRLQIVAIAGNHDSALRLDAPDALQRVAGAYVVGSVRAPAGMVLPLQCGGRVAALIAAVPFPRPGDLPPDLAPAAGVRRLYGAVLDEARARREPGQALLCAGHLYMVGGRMSELSERQVFGGHQHGVPVDVFPDDVAYVALGHLHLAQAVGGRAHVRYSESPIPLSLAEASYPHQVVLVELEGEDLSSVRSLPVPRVVDIVRVPEEGAASPGEVLARLARLPPLLPTMAEERRPYLEVAVGLDGPLGNLRDKVGEALRGKAARLIKLTVTHAGDGRGLAEACPGETLSELTPEQVFLRRYARVHGGAPPPPLLAAFRDLVDEVGS